MELPHSVGEMVVSQSILLWLSEGMCSHGECVGCYGRCVSTREKVNKGQRS
ncbi:unnamed protein product [Chondrus crispus]|uniref:Uncharacterized protein n=1 Tax=Chondrus crispus TaxID=2769 RepID=R7QGU8_CHOCR|nr:unnamed protein product [Chondrus crispus]CDF36968.1 unnamed protein product [Chondrus crispus]|eukprot:XP_005716787.1 unnamed protein product [Chondrus crispus]